MKVLGAIFVEYSGMGRRSAVSRRRFQSTVPILVFVPFFCPFFLPDIFVLVLVLALVLALALVLVLFLSTVSVMSCRMLCVEWRASRSKLGHVNLAKMYCKTLWGSILFILALATIVIQINDSGTFLWRHLSLGVIQHILMEIWVTLSDTQDKRARLRAQRTRATYQLYSVTA